MKYCFLELLASVSPSNYISSQSHLNFKLFSWFQSWLVFPIPNGRSRSEIVCQAEMERLKRKLKFFAHAPVKKNCDSKPFCSWSLWFGNIPSIFMVYEICHLEMHTLIFSGKRDYTKLATGTHPGFPTWRASSKMIGLSCCCQNIRIHLNCWQIAPMSLQSTVIPPTSRLYSIAGFQKYSICVCVNWWLGSTDTFDNCWHQR